MKERLEDIWMIVSFLVVLPCMVCIGMYDIVTERLSAGLRAWKKKLRL